MSVYLTMMTDNDYNEANDKCIEIFNTTLASIHSIEQQNETMNSIISTTRRSWIGLNDDHDATLKVIMVGLMVRHKILTLHGVQIYANA